MALSRNAALAILRQNLGFKDPEQWVDYAIRHCFTSISATSVPNCPDCGHSPRSQLGQYVHYSTLMRLMVCGSCHLIWSDTHLDPHIVSAHFERTYKDRDYFRAARLAIFRHLAAAISRITPPGGSVLDIGGAQGDLMHLLKHRRPDAAVVVHDLSESAVRYAEEQFGLRTICGDVAALQAHGARYDVVVLSDVLYYEPRLADFWWVLSRLVAPGGSVVIRVPNKLPLIHAHQILSRLVRFTAHHRVLDTIRYFNPEHIYILSRKYLTARLRQLGFAPVRVFPSPPIAPPDSVPRHALARVLFRAAAGISLLSGRKLVLTPSMMIIGTRAESGEMPSATSNNAMELPGRVHTLPVPRPAREYPSHRYAGRESWAAEERREVHYVGAHLRRFPGQGLLRCVLLAWHRRPHRILVAPGLRALQYECDGVEENGRLADRLKEE